MRGTEQMREGAATACVLGCVREREREGESYKTDLRLQTISVRDSCAGRSASSTQGSVTC